MDKALLLAHLRYGAGRLGRWGWGGLVLLVAAAAIQWGTVADLKADSADIAEQLAARRLKPAPTETPEAQRARQLAVVVAGLPDAQGALQTLAAIHKAAREQHLQLATGDYRLQALNGAAPGSLGVQRYQLTFPVRGDYLALRQWLSATLNQTPSLALDELSLKRDDAKVSELDSRVRMTLYLRGH